MFLPKPAMFIPAIELAGITVGRSGGIHIGASFTDLVIERAGVAEPEIFSNINKGDVAALAGYVNAVIRNRSRGIESASGSQGCRRTDSDDEEADEDYEDMESQEEEGQEENGRFKMACSSVSAAKHSSKRQADVTKAKEPVAKRTRSSLRSMQAKDAKLEETPDLPSDHESFHESEEDEEEEEEL
mmetsp:Transcript_49051/g.94818  ORF Transcript_49051/g.94818 Transcript_49051/m.94818 type:complete len:186 (-) Transcript_49051:14-571(-)